MKENGESVIKIEEVKPEIFKKIIKSVYFPYIDVTSISECVELLYSANRFQMTELELDLITGISRAEISILDFPSLWECSQTLSLIPLQDSLLRWVAQNWMLFLNDESEKLLTSSPVLMTKLTKLFYQLTEESDLDSDFDWDGI